MKRLILLAVIFSGMLNAALAQTEAQTPDIAHTKIVELEKYVRENTVLKKCRGCKTIVSVGGNLVKEVKLCLPKKGKTSVVKINPFLIRGRKHILIIPPQGTFGYQAFKLKVRGRYQEESFTKPVLISKIGRKIFVSYE